MPFSTPEAAAQLVLLDAREVTIRFGGLVAVNRVSFQLHENEIVGLIGPNGAGKTTLFNLITGHLVPTRGRISFKGREIDRLSCCGQFQDFTHKFMVAAVAAKHPARADNIMTAHERAHQLFTCQFAATVYIQRVGPICFHIG